MESNPRISAMAVINWENDQLRGTLNSLARLDPGRMKANYRNLAIDAAVRGERIAVSGRNLVFLSVPEERDEYLLLSKETLGIEVEVSEGIFHARLPAQLPWRRKNSNGFLTQPLLAAMRELAAKTAIPRFDKAAVCFVHIYDRETCKQVRDHDNIETKQVIDVLSAYLLADDNGLQCSQHHWSFLGNGNRTEVYVMEQLKLPEWINQRKNDLLGCENGYTI